MEGVNIDNILSDISILNDKPINNQSLLFKFVGPSIEEYYINGASHTIVEMFQYGIIINTNNINYICTTYFPNCNTSDISDNNYKIFYNDIEISYDECYKQYMFNLIIFKINIIPNVYYYTINNYNGNVIYRKKNCGFIQTNKQLIEIPLSKFEYKLTDAKHPKLPKLLMLTIKFNTICSATNESGMTNYLDIINPGNAVYKILNDNIVLLGIVSHIDLQEEDDYFEIIIIPTYTIIKMIKYIKENTLNNIWYNIQDGIIIEKYNNNNFQQLMIGDIINKINEKYVKNGLINIPILNYNVPLQTYIWYNQYVNKHLDFKIQIDRNSVMINVIYPYKDINTIMPIYFSHNNDSLINEIKYFNNYKITLQNMSFELIDYLTENDILISNKFMDIIFENPFNHKINNVIITNIMLEEDNVKENGIDIKIPFLIGIANGLLRTPIQIDILQIIPLESQNYYQTIIDMRSMYHKLKTRSSINNLKIKIINNDIDIYNNIILNIN